jgi:hypothetical protein
VTVRQSVSQSVRYCNIHKYNHPSTLVVVVVVLLLNSTVVLIHVSRDLLISLCCIALHCMWCTSQLHYTLVADSAGHYILYYFISWQRKRLTNILPAFALHAQPGSQAASGWITSPLICRRYSCCKPICALFPANHKQTCTAVA